MDKSFADFGHNSRYESNECSAQTTRNESSDDNNEITNKMVDIKLDVLDVWERLAIRQMDSHSHCLQVLVEYVNDELKRFADEEDICRRLKTFDLDLKKGFGWGECHQK